MLSISHGQFARACLLRKLQHAAVPAPASNIAMQHMLKGAAAAAALLAMTCCVFPAPDPKRNHMVNDRMGG